MKVFSWLNRGGLAVVVVLVAGQGCAAAVSFQDAKMLGKGRSEFTPYVSQVKSADEGRTENYGTAFGGLFAVGASEKVDLLLGYQHFRAEGGGGANYLGIGPKFSLVKDRAALSVPFVVDVPGFEEFRAIPTALFTVPLGGGITLNPGVKAVVSTCTDCDLLVGGQVGLSIPVSRGKIVMRPEIGMLKNPGEPGTLWSFGFGLSMR